MSDFGDKPTAVLGRRYVAHLIDIVVHVAVVAVPFVLLGEKATSSDTSPIVDAYRQNPFYAVRLDDQAWLFTRNDLITIGAVSVGFVLLVTVIIQGRLGWTVGKALTGLRTVRADGGRPGIFRALGRTILLAIDALPSWLLPIVGPLIALFTSDNRRLGDLVCGTYVVHKGAVGKDPTGATDLDPDYWGWASADGPAPVTVLADGEALRVGDDATDDADAVSAPVSGATETMPAAGTTETEAPAYQPQWDPARQAYLQWDPRRRTWLQFDDAAGEWRPIG